MKRENLKRRLHAIWTKSDRAVRSLSRAQPKERERDFCTDLCVWIVRGLETEVFNAHLFEEYTHEA